MHTDIPSRHMWCYPVMALSAISSCNINTDLVAPWSQILLICAMVWVRYLPVPCTFHLWRMNDEYHKELMMAIMSVMKIYRYSNVVVWVQVVGMFGQESLHCDPMVYTG